MSQNIDVKFGLNRIDIIVSLKGNHHESAEDLFKYHIAPQFPSHQTHFHIVHSRSQLINILSMIEQEMDGETYPMIHIEAHGLESGKGIELTSGEQIEWSELRPNFRLINHKCKNNLTLCIAACNSMYIVEELIESVFESLESRTPFFCFIGASAPISVDQMIEAMPVFYGTLSKTKDWNVAISSMNEHTSVKFTTLFCYKAFLIFVNKFANTWVKERVERIHKDPENRMDFYCGLYLYTYGRSCDSNAIIDIMTNEKFYVDLFNKRMNDFLFITDYPDMDGRFPKIDSIKGFESNIPRLVWPT